MTENTIPNEIEINGVRYVRADAEIDYIGAAETIALIKTLDYIGQETGARADLVRRFHLPPQQRPPMGI